MLKKYEQFLVGALPDKLNTGELKLDYSYKNGANRNATVSYGEVKTEAGTLIEALTQMFLHLHKHDITA